MTDTTEDLEPLHSGKGHFASAAASAIQERFTAVYAKRKGQWRPVVSQTTPRKRKTK